MNRTEKVWAIPVISAPKSTSPITSGVISSNNESLFLLQHRDRIPNEGSDYDAT